MNAMRWMWAVVLLVPAVLWAQGRDDGAVAGVGAVTLQVKPDVLRMQVMLTADGGSLRAAIDSLKQVQESTKKEVLSLGATQATLWTADARVMNVRQDERAQMSRMMRMRMADKKAAAPTSQPVTVYTTLKAEWPISGTTAEEILLWSHDLQGKIKDSLNKAGRSGKKLTPQEEEVLEEEGGSQGGFNPYDDGSSKPGVPAFVYVKTIADADRQKAQGEAFQKARAQAAELAKVAGAELGVLRHLSTQSSAEDEEGYNPYGRRYRPQFALSANGREAIGNDPASVQLVLTVSVAYTLK